MNLDGQKDGQSFNQVFEGYTCDPTYGYRGRNYVLFCVKVMVQIEKIKTFTVKLYAFKEQPLMKSILAFVSMEHNITIFSQGN